MATWHAETVPGGRHRAAASSSARRYGERMPAPMDTVTEAVARLRRAGFEHEVDVHQGRVQFRFDGTWHPAAVVDVEEIERFEGTSDPGDEMIVLGVRDERTGRRGVLTAAYGPDTEPDTAACLRDLVDDR